MSNLRQTQRSPEGPRHLHRIPRPPPYKANNRSRSTTRAVRCSGHAGELRPMAKDLIPSSSWERPRSPLAQTTLCGGASEGAKLSLENACPLRGVCRPWEGSRMAWRVAPLCKGILYFLMGKNTGFQMLFTNPGDIKIVDHC